MKNIKSRYFLTIISTHLFLLLFTTSYSQTGAKTYPVLADSTSESPLINNPNQTSIEKMGTCDGVDVRIFPSPNPQAEIHLSINHVNPNVILLSSQTYPNNNSWQGAYWSTNAGVTWTGSDHLPNLAPGRRDSTGPKVMEF